MYNFSFSKSLKVILIFSLFVLSCQSMRNTTKESDKWVEFVYGKPYMIYFEAKEKVSNQWGINYEAKFMGCVIDDELIKKGEPQEKANQKYFTKLESKFGKDWDLRFELDVKKQLPIYTNVENPKWQVPMVGLPVSENLEARAAVAKEWGINYEPLLLGCDPSAEGIDEARNKAIEDSKAYLADIEAHFGKDWKIYFEKEVEAKLKSKKVK